MNSYAAKATDSGRTSERSAKSRGRTAQCRSRAYAATPHDLCELLLCLTLAPSQLCIGGNKLTNRVALGKDGDRLLDSLEGVHRY